MRLLRNRSNSEKWVLYGNRRHYIPPLATKHFEDDLAQTFLREHGESVVVSNEGINQIEDYVVERPKHVWLYNATGDERLSKTIKAVRKEGKNIIHVDVPNPLVEARVITQMVHGGYTPFKDEGEGDSYRALGPRKIEIWPYTRKAFPNHIARFMMERDAISEIRGAIKYSRPPAVLEPDSSWDYKELQDWIQMVDSNADVGPSEDEVTGDTMGFDAEEVIDRAKEVLMRKIFFLVADPKIKIPNEDEWRVLTRKSSKTYEARV